MGYYICWGHTEQGLCKPGLTCRWIFFFLIHIQSRFPRCERCSDISKYMSACSRSPTTGFTAWPALKQPQWWSSDSQRLSCLSVVIYLELNLITYLLKLTRLSLPWPHFLDPTPASVTTGYNWIPGSRTARLRNRLFPLDSVRKFSRSRDKDPFELLKSILQ